MTAYDSESFRKTPPEIKNIRASELPPMQSLTSNEGLRFHILRKPDIPVVVIDVIVRGGYAEAPSWGAAWLRSLTQNEATASFPAGKIAEILDFNGATFKSSVDSHFTRFSLMSLDGKVDALLPAFAEIVGRPTFPEHEFAVRREAMASQIEVYQKNVSFIASVESDRQIMGPSHPLATFDTPQQIRQITPADMLVFQQQTTKAAGIDIYVWGNITPALIEKISKTFSSTIPAGPAPELSLAPFSPAPAGDFNISRLEQASQCAVNITIPAITRDHPDYLPLHMAIYALGGYFGSRLMLNIREEKGLTYGISATLQGHIEGSIIGISAETDNRHCFRLIDEVSAEMLRLASDPPKDDELTRMRRSALSEQIAVADSPASIVNQHISELILNLPDNYFKDKLNTISTITSEQIAEVAARYLLPSLNRTAIAGNPEK